MAAFAVAAPGASGLLGPASATLTKYYGFALRETAGSTAVVRLRVGSVSGLIVEEVSLAANESAREFYGPDAVLVGGQLYYELVSGTVEGSVRVA